MPAVGAADGGDARGMPGSGQPVMHCGPDPATVERRIPLPLMTGDEQQNPFVTGDGALECTVNRRPRPVEGMSVQVQGAIRLDLPGPQAPIPPAVECRTLQIFHPFWR